MNKRIASFAPVVSLAGLVALFLAGAWLGCSDGGAADEHTGMSCQVAGNCYRDTKAPTMGDIMCLLRVPGGYCTHLCQVDTDCCAVEGECKGGFAQVCAPFESTGQKMCFLSCEAAIVDPTGKDATVFCQENANRAFICRSTGGGSQNRKVCVPGA